MLLTTSELLYINEGLLLVAFVIVVASSDLNS